MKKKDSYKVGILFCGSESLFKDRSGNKSLCFLNSDKVVFRNLQKENHLLDVQKARVRAGVGVGVRGARKPCPVGTD